MSDNPTNPRPGELRVELEQGGDVTFYFDGSPEPFGLQEFIVGTPTWEIMYRIEQQLILLREIWDDSHGL